MAGRNIKIMETVSISASKYIQIINIGDKYFAIGVGKDTITYLCELDGSSLEFKSDGTNKFNAESFKDILDKFKKNGQVSDNEESDM
jgi:flagellar protein FliO/FliZ